MAKQAKQLIDNRLFFNNYSIITSWDYDNRNESNSETPAPKTLYDNACGKGVSMSREFQEQTNGKMVLEMLYNTENTPNGAVISITSSKNEEVFSLESKDDLFYFNNKQTLAPALLGDTRIRVCFDLDTKRSTFELNGSFYGEYQIKSTADAANLKIATSGKTNIKLTPKVCELYIDYILKETLLYTDSHFSHCWKTWGNVEVKRHFSAIEHSCYTYAKMTGKSSAYVSFDKTDADIISDNYILIPNGTEGAKICLRNGENEIFGIVTKDSAFYTLNGGFLRKFTPNVWQEIRFETLKDNLIIKIDGKKCGEFKFTKDSIDNLLISLNTDTEDSISFADNLIWENVQYEDYCPEPKKVRHNEYEVGVNVCNMWHEGSHWGWDYISYFKDNMPLIGAYDEGIVEVADWEIRFMVEHGITFQHVCWYCPDPYITSPIKRSRMDYALRDGFMNARYSDKMKFIIMWENLSYKNTNPEDFKEYVWKYWCEYFFTDDRYLKVNNRPILSIWNFAFVEHWGGEENARKLIEFMNEDIKRLGFDGIYIMGSMLGYSYERYKNFSDYCDLMYSYHFEKSGSIADYQINAIDTIIGYNLAPYIKTVSVGFNSAPWSGAEYRSPLISLYGYEKVLKHAKSLADKKKNKEWYDKLFMMSTWNEYGEGTYIMPSHHNGFGYLDKIREVFAEGAGKCDNLLPNENQLKRLCYLYRKNRVVIRRLGIEIPWPGQEIKYFVNGVEQKLAFAPLLNKDGKIILSLDQKYCAYTALKLFHKYDITKKELTIANHDTEIKLYMESTKALVNGKEITLPYYTTMRDGLPTICINTLCELLGYKCVYDNEKKVVSVEV